MTVTISFPCVTISLLKIISTGDIIYQISYVGFVCDINSFITKTEFWLILCNERSSHSVVHTWSINTIKIIRREIYGYFR